MGQPLPGGMTATYNPEGVNFQAIGPAPTSTPFPTAPEMLPTLPMPSATPSTVAGMVSPTATPRSTRANQQILPEEHALVRSLSHRLALGQPLTDADREYLQQWLHEPYDAAERGKSAQTDWSSSLEIARRKRLKGQ